MSVTLAPRARILVKASWPGVSMKTIWRALPSWSFTSTWWAPMAWVMPPASPAATLVWRMASSREVLPWSTWPMMVTTGGRGIFSPATSLALFHGHLDILLEGDDVGEVAELPGDLLGQLGVEGLVDGGEDAAVQQLGHDILGGAVALLGEFLHRHALGEHDDADLVLDVLGGDLLGAAAGLAELQLQGLGLALGAAALVVLLLAGEVGAAAGALLGIGIDGTGGGQRGTAAAHAGAAGTTGTGSGTARDGDRQDGCRDRLVGDHRGPCRAGRRDRRGAGRDAGGHCRPQAGPGAAGCSGPVPGTAAREPGCPTS